MYKIPASVVGSLMTGMLLIAFTGCARDIPREQGLSQAQVRQLTTQYRDEWLARTEPEARDMLRIGSIQSVERTSDGWHVTFVTETGHDQPEGIHDYYLHVYIDLTGQKIVRGPDVLS